MSYMLVNCSPPAIAIQSLLHNLCTKRSLFSLQGLARSRPCPQFLRSSLYTPAFSLLLNDRNPKYFIFDLPHDPKSVSIDRIKPAYIPSTPPLTALHSSGNSVPTPPPLSPPSPPCTCPSDEQPPPCSTPSPTLVPDGINVDQPIPFFNLSQSIF